MEDWDVATSDIPGAFLQTDYDKEDIHMNMEGETVFLLEDIDPSYYKYFIYICRRRGNTCLQNTISLYMAL